MFGIQPNAMQVNSFAPEASLLNFDPNLIYGNFVTERRLLPDLPDLSNQTRPHLVARNYGTPNHIREPNLVLQQWPTVLAALAFPDQAGRQHMEWSTVAVGIPPTYLGGRQQMTENYPFLPTNGPESGVWNFGVAPSSQYGGPHDWNLEASTSLVNGPGSRAWNFEVTPHNYLGSGAWNFQVPPSQYPATYGHMTLMDTMLQSGPRFLGPNSNTPRTFISQFGHFYGGLGVAHTPESFAAEIESNHRALLETMQFNVFQSPVAMGYPIMHEDIRFDIDSVPYEFNAFHSPVVMGFPVMHEDIRFDIANMSHEETQFNAFQPPVIMGSLGMHGDMGFDIDSMSFEATQFNNFHHPVIMGYPVMHENLRLDTDNMSSEELSTSEEQFENMSSGLSEETILELLKKQNYERVASDPPSDPESCCICLETYVHGEEIGALDCGDEFHTKCIKKWLLIKNECPICQSKGLDA